MRLKQALNCLKLFQFIVSIVLQNVQRALYIAQCYRLRSAVKSYLSGSSFCPFVPSVTLCHCAKTAKHILQIFSPSSSLAITVVAKFRRDQL